MMRHQQAIVPAALLLVFCTAAIALAQPPGDQGTSSLPVAGAPPEGDYLQPLSLAAQYAAVLRMLGVVMVALTAIMLMLRFLVKRDSRLAEKAGPADDLVRRAQAALDKADDDRPDATE